MIAVQDDLKLVKISLLAQQLGLQNETQWSTKLQLVLWLIDNISLEEFVVQQVVIVIFVIQYIVYRYKGNGTDGLCPRLPKYELLHDYHLFTPSIALTDWCRYAVSSQNQQTKIDEFLMVHHPDNNMVSLVWSLVTHLGHRGRPVKNIWLMLEVVYLVKILN